MSAPNTFKRVLRHLWLDRSDAARVIPPAAVQRLRERVAASERLHTGEVRICVEGSLPPSYLWRHLRERRPAAQIVRERAIMMFAKLRVWDTEENNGVLIYLLLAERAIELVADRGVNSRLPAGFWQQTVQRLGASLQAGQFEQGLEQALAAVTELLVAHFPAPEGAAPRNELPDTPVLR